MTHQTTSRPTLTALSTVQCLECAFIYAKPARGGTVEQNPGCPRCGYIGWIPAAVEVSRDEEQSHFVADLLQRRAGLRR